MGKNPEIEKKYFEVSTLRCGCHPAGELYMVALASSLGKAFFLSVRTQGEDPVQRPPSPDLTSPEFFLISLARMFHRAASGTGDDKLVFSEATSTPVSTGLALHAPR